MFLLIGTIMELCWDDHEKLLEARWYDHGICVGGTLVISDKICIVNMLESISVLLFPKIVINRYFVV